MISIGSRLEDMVTKAWKPEDSATNQNITPNAQDDVIPTLATSIKEYIRFQDFYTGTNTSNDHDDDSEQMDKISTNGESLKDLLYTKLNELVDKIPTNSMLHGESLKDLLGPDDDSAISNRLLDWLALYTGSTSRIHLTSVCNCELATSSSNISFSFPTMLVTSSLSFPLKINGKIHGICAFSPMSKSKKAGGTVTAYQNATHQVH